MFLYYIFWIEIIVMFIIVVYYLRRCITEEQDRKIMDAEQRIGSLSKKEV